MASFHHRIKSGKKGKAADHAAYITGQGRYRHRGDVLFTCYGNLPIWAQYQPEIFWREGDEHERANGAVYREMEISLPNELTLEQLQALVDKLVRELVGIKPYQYAVHAPESSLEGVTHVHLHLMYSDRMPDGIERTPGQMFWRFNSQHPERGGCRKDSGGKNPVALRDAVIRQRERVAELQNEALAQAGHDARVDHRTLQQQGINRAAERPLRPETIRKMSAEEKARHVETRRDSVAGFRREAPSL